ncbi:hypothetical protein H7X68_03555, partial [Candidatus Saccharibacteria bacterium]|nr:hypothetical protein [Candidatus Saccharibacteria bacterium]
TKKIIEKIKEDNERGARQGIIEDLFVDFYRSRRQVYYMNFIRGIFFGFGTVLGGTVLVAIIIWVLGQFVDWFPLIGDFIKQVIDAIQRPR